MIFLPPPVLGYSLPFSAFSLPFSAELGPVFEFFSEKNEKWCMQVWPSENHRNPHFQVRIPKSGHLHSRAAPHDPSSGGRMAYHGLLLWTGVSGLACRSGLWGRKWNQHLPSNIGVQTDPKFVHILNLTSKVPSHCMILEVCGSGKPEEQRKRLQVLRLVRTPSSWPGKAMVFLLGPPKRYCHFWIFRDPILNPTYN